ncbi:MAG: hypothetical protein V4548_12975 [Bacteroidota bacterium]
MKNFKYLFCLILIFTVSCDNTTKIVKIPTEYIRKNSFNIINHRIFFFAVRNADEYLINEYVIKYIKSVKDFSKISLEVIFYEYNSKLNENTVYGEGDDTIYHNGEYLICSFKWDKGKFLGKYVYENGEFITIQYFNLPR